MTILNDKIEQQPSRLHSLTLPISKQQSGMKRMVRRWYRKCRITTVAVIFSLLPEGRTSALPIEGLTAVGKATITNPSSTDMHIVQESRQAIINWNSFDISKNESVNITQPTCQSILLNRVLGNNPSHIFGTLTANGQIFLVNQNGVLFAPGASVNAGGVVASTLAIRDSDFLSEKYTLFKNGSAGSVINQGNINAGFTALLGSSAENTGSIIASKGTAGIAVGEGITLSFDPYGLVAIKVDQATYNAQIKNSGLIEADGGSVVMSASAADALLSTGVNNSGRVRAGTITEHNGKVSIEAGTISNSGSIEAGNNIDATAAGTMVNTGKFSAPEIHATVNNLLDAGLWDTGGYPTGGNILINAFGSIEQTAASHIRADGNQGGLISITAGKKLYFSGSVSACGIAGQGGEIDITAPETIIAGTTASADGESGGGRIFIGGGWQGNDFTLANAATTLVTQSTRLNANALDNGNGGTVVIWSDQSTSFAGTIEARGGRNNGNGGEVEISSHDRLTFEGNVITAAPNGENGLLLLDPRNITLEVHPTTQTFYLTPLADANPEAGNQHGSGKIVELSNGNIIVATPSDDFAATNAGAVRLYKPDGTLLSMLTGSTANDMAGYSLIALAGNNNAVTSTPNWSNSGLANAGAATWIDGYGGQNIEIR